MGGVTYRCVGYPACRDGRDVDGCMEANATAAGLYRVGHLRRSSYLVLTLRHVAHILIIVSCCTTLET